MYLNMTSQITLTDTSVIYMSIVASAFVYTVIIVVDSRCTVNVFVLCDDSRDTALVDRYLVGIRAGSFWLLDHSLPWNTPLEQLKRTY